MSAIENPVPVVQPARDSDDILFELKPNPENWLYESTLPITLSQCGVTDDEFAEFLVHCNTILNDFHQKKANYRAYVISMLVVCILLSIPTACVSMIGFVIGYFVYKRKLKLALRNCFLELLAFVEQQSYHSQQASSGASSLSITIPATESSEHAVSSIMRGLFAKRHIISDMKFDPTPTIVFTRAPASIVSQSRPVVSSRTPIAIVTHPNGVEYLNLSPVLERTTSTPAETTATTNPSIVRQIATSPTLVTNDPERASSTDAQGYLENSEDSANIVDTA